MATIVGDVLQLVLRSTYLSEQINNIFHFQITQVGSGAPASQALSEAFGNHILPDLRPVTSDQITYDDGYCINLRDVGDFYTDTYGVQGTLVGGSTLDLPSYVALGFRYNRVAAGQRHGYKRFAGLVQAQTDGNDYNGNPTDVADLADTLIYNEVGATYYNWHWTPFVASRPILYGFNPTGYVPVTCEFRGVTTQNTRKP